MVLNPNFFLPGTDRLLKAQARMEDKVRIKNLTSLLAFFEKFSRDVRGVAYFIARERSLAAF